MTVWYLNKNLIMEYNITLKTLESVKTILSAEMLALKINIMGAIEYTLINS